ncbi:hypothetical protein GCM10028864_62330 [Microlunatus parietis]
MSLHLCPVDSGMGGDREAGRLRRNGGQEAEERAGGRPGSCGWGSCGVRPALHWRFRREGFGTQSGFGRER